LHKNHKFNKLIKNLTSDVKDYMITIITIKKKYISYGGTQDDA